MEQFRRGELVFDVIDAGPADGPVVVLLHGFPEQHTMWQPVVDRLTAQGYRCLVLARNKALSPATPAPTMHTSQPSTTTSSAVTADG